MPSLIQHQKFTKHCLCPRCDPYESYEELLEARLPSIDKYICPECERGFAHKPSLEVHQHESLHANCFDCNIVSPTKLLHALHMRLHAPVLAKWAIFATHFRCCDCKRDFVNEKALTDHLRYSQAHAENQDENIQPVNGKRCSECKRNFESQRALEQHLASVRHNPLCNIKFVAAKKCKKHFDCPSTQLRHLESGKCISKMTKTKLNEAIFVNDT